MKRFLTIFVLTFAVVFATGAVTILFLYDAAIRETQTTLLEVVEARKQLMTAVAQFDREHSADFEGGARAATLTQIAAAHQSFPPNSRESEYTVAEERAGQIVFIFRQRHSSLDVPEAVPLDAENAEPMRRALRGQTGTVIARDYRGVSVLAAHTYVDALQVGLVVKVDLAAVQRPLWQAASYAGFVALVLLAITSMILARLIGPINKQLVESEIKYRRLVEEQSNLVCRTDRHKRITFANEAFLDYFQTKTFETIGKPIGQVVCTGCAVALEKNNQEADSQLATTVECRATVPDLGLRWLQWSVTVDALSGEMVLVGLDVTERKRAERALAAEQRAKRVMMSCNALLEQASDEAVFLPLICDLISSEGGYQLAWVGLLSDEQPPKIDITARSRKAAAMFDESEQFWIDATFLDPAALQRLQNNETIVIDEFKASPDKAVLRERGTRFGFGALAVVPFNVGQNQRMILVIHSVDPHAFSLDEQTLLKSLAYDLSVACRGARARARALEAARKASESDKKRQQAMEAIVAALSQTIETRDPYTAGHQRHVADLAVKIARKLGLSEARLKGIKMGAIIHDVGKIAVPAQVLTKPGRLTDVEMALVKQHAETGFEIIKDIEFDYPVAAMVRHHHERIDGTGYPDGLKGDEICLEAQIIGVADVVDAITAHRPYRPALGLDTAIEELQQHRGKRYAEAIVDACLEVLAEDAAAADPRAKLSVVGGTSS